MGSVFLVYASQGRENYVELNLPASDYEMLDMMERLRLEPDQLDRKSTRLNSSHE